MQTFALCMKKGSISLLLLHQYIWLIVIPAEGTISHNDFDFIMLSTESTYAILQVGRTLISKTTQYRTNFNNTFFRFSSVASFADSIKKSH